MPAVAADEETVFRVLADAVFSITDGEVGIPRETADGDRATAAVGQGDIGSIGVGVISFGDVVRIFCCAGSNESHLVFVGVEHAVAGCGFRERF